MGQALLPEHFYAQEQSLRDEFGVRFGLQSAPCWGLGSLQWDSFQLLKGIISIQDMVLILPSGALVDVPGNTAPAFLNLNATGATKAPVYVHLQSGYDLTSTGEGEVAEEGIERIVQRIELSTNPYSETGIQSFKLAEFESTPEGAWSLRPEYLPPMVQLGSSPFFEAYLQRMESVARTLKQVLLEEIQENYLATQNQASAKQCLRALFGFEAMLVDLRNEIRLHPYEVFRELRSLYIDLCVFRDVQPTAAQRPYAHEELGPCFAEFLSQLEEQVRPSAQKVPYVPFKAQEGLHVCELSRDIKRAKDVFLLIQKPQVATKLDLARIKLASESRIHAVYERALRGIPFQRIENPPFRHGLAATVEFYALAPGQEWDHAVREGKVVLFDSPQLEGTRLYLYWSGAE